MYHILVFNLWVSSLYKIKGKCNFMQLCRYSTRGGDQYEWCICISFTLISIYYHQVRCVSLVFSDS